MAVKIVDLSDRIENGTVEPIPHEITYISHEAGAQQAAQLFGLDPSDFPEGKAWSVELVNLATHSGTHVDAPYHYGEHSEGKPARTIDEMPLEWFFGDGVVLNFSSREAGELITVADVRKELQRIDYTLKPGDIVLIRTDVWKRFGEPGYQEMHPGMSEEATLWLVEQGIRVTGIDAWGWDRPFSVMAREYKEEGKNRLWAAHFAGKEKEYCHIEKLTNLDQLPPFGFKVACFPVSIKGASAGWTRAVAIFEE